MGKMFNQVEDFLGEKQRKITKTLRMHFLIYDFLEFSVSIVWIRYRLSTSEKMIVIRLTGIKISNAKTIFLNVLQFIKMSRNF